MSAGVIKNFVYRGQLLVFVLANIAVCWIAFNGGDLLSGDWTKFAKDWAAALPPSIGLLAIGAITGSVDQMMKARIVYWRWAHPLPGSRAFSKLMYEDPRIDVARLQAKHGPFPTDPNEQNSLWYRLFKTVSGREEVTHVHRDFLINRDLATLALLSFVIAVPLAFFFATAPGAPKVLALILIGEYLLFRQAAVFYGNRFVTTVLALKSAQGR